MKFELRKLTDYSDEAILEEIRRVANIVRGPTLSRTEFCRHSRVCDSTVRRRFGGWQKALRAAGLGGRFDSSSKRVPREEIIAELKRVSALLGATVFTREQFNTHASFTSAVVRRAFGTWHKAMKAAGLPTNVRGKRYTDDDCFENLLSVWTHYGRAPAHGEMKLPPSIVGPKAYILRFGTWRKALQAFVDRVNADVPSFVEPAGAVQEQKPTDETSIPECDRREIRLGLRYMVLKRDRFKCVACGRSPATYNNLVLHVDHIKPVAKGGKTILENLQTYCQDCNLGKGSTGEDTSV